MRDLDEAIKHCHEVAEEQRQRSELYDEWSTEDEGKIEECLDCAKDHEQLARWLEELKEWHKRVEVSKDGGRASIILYGETFYLTDGHVKALLDYDVKKTTQDTIDRIIKNVTSMREATHEDQKGGMGN